MSELELKKMSFESGMELRVTGVPKPNIDRFSINVGYSRCCNVALHIDMRFNYICDQRQIILNSKKGGHWQEEVKNCNFPFHWGQEFEVTVIFADNKFYINLHDGQVLQFPNRLGDKQYDYIWIEGDVTIKGIHVN